MYVDAIRSKDVIKIVERDDNGDRVYRNFNIPAEFYYESPDGDYESIHFKHVTKPDRVKLSKAVFGSVAQMKESLKTEGHIYENPHETDLSVIQEMLATKYPDHKTPKLNVAFFDIETAFHPTKGFAPANDPFMNVTAISTYLNWKDELWTFVMRPEAMTDEEAEQICSEFDNTYLIKDESEMLKLWLELISNADILSGWNSEGFDIPYLVNRTRLLLGDDYTRNFCLWQQKPRIKTVRTKWGEFESYELVGRVHMDYLALFKKMTAHRETMGYKLDTIAEMLIDEKKVAYEGSLDQLYNTDFRKFVDYSRQDVMLLKKIDDKEKYLELANTLAHDNTVCLPTTLKTVQQTEQAIINEARTRCMRVPERKHGYGSGGDGITSMGIVGGYVIPCIRGAHDWIGSIDINSLYPSIIRTLNISPETIVGQFLPTITEAEFKTAYNEWTETRGDEFKFAELWHEKFAVTEYDLILAKDEKHELTLEYNSGEQVKGNGKQFYEMIFDGELQWALSANGTIFRTDIPGIVPSLLDRWYSERQELQAKMKEAIAAGDKASEDFWDNRQKIKKINLNALYGALLNEGCRFFDPRMGQSVTLTGRCITRHMAAKMNELLSGEYSHQNGVLIYGDTDSIYFSVWPRIREAVKNGEMDWNADTAIALYDQVADDINKTWPEFMVEKFHTTKELGAIIKGGREIVGSRGVMAEKKKYAIMVVDDEGVRKDVDGKPGKMKITGLEIVRSDTPETVRKLLKKLMEDVLINLDEDSAMNIITSFKIEFAKMQPWEMGAPKGLKKLTDYAENYHSGTGTVPGHVRAAYNWNTLREDNNDLHATPINNGDKIVICDLTKNEYGYTSIAYPIDEPVLPDWFKELPFDTAKMSEKIIDKKVGNMLGTLGWDLKRDVAAVAADSLFDED